MLGIPTKHQILCKYDICAIVLIECTCCSSAQQNNAQKHGEVNPCNGIMIIAISNAAIQSLATPRNLWLIFYINQYVVWYFVELQAV